MTLLARWRADQLVFEDTSGTDAAENTDGVAAWGIYEGSQAGSVATQSTSGNRPIWNSDDGGYPSVSVTGSSTQRLNLAHSAPWVITSFSWLAAIKITMGNLTHVWGRGSAWTNAGVMSNPTISGTSIYQITFHTGYITRAIPTAHPTHLAATWFVIGGTADGSCIKSYINTQSASRVLQSQTVNFGTNPLTLFGDGSTFAQFHMTGAAREFAFWDSALSETDMQTELAAAMTRWGITNTVEPPSSGVTGFTGLSGVGRLGT